MAVNQPVVSMESESGQTDPGAVDNRLTLNPNDRRWAFVADWADGVDYTVVAKVRQISPGELEVMSIRQHGPTPKAKDDDAMPAKTAAKPGKVSKAVVEMDEEE